MLERRKRFFLSLASIFIGILAALAVLSLGELITRLSTNIIFLGNSSNLFSPARYAGSRGNTPNIRAISFGEVVYTDEMGFRVPSADYRYPSNEVYRVLILGDSIAFGPGVPEQKTFVGLLRSAKPDWAIFNTAVIGYDLNDYLNVSKTLLKTQRYQLAVLVLCLSQRQIIRRSRNFTRSLYNLAILHEQRFGAFNHCRTITLSLNDLRRERLVEKSFEALSLSQGHNHRPIGALSGMRLSAQAEIAA